MSHRHFWLRIERRRAALAGRMVLDQLVNRNAGKQRKEVFCEKNKEIYDHNPDIYFNLVCRL